MVTGATVLAAGRLAIGRAVVLIWVGVPPEPTAKFSGVLTVVPLSVI